MATSQIVGQIPMKCKHCRFLILEYPKDKVEDAHGEPFAFVPEGHGVTISSPGNHCVSDVWYIPEESMPKWLKDICTEKGEWVKGKINCPKCEARIGSYNFVTGFKCPCGSRVVPPIHIVKSKVDFTRVILGI